MMYFKIANKITWSLFKCDDIENVGNVYSKTNFIFKNTGRLKTSYVAHAQGVEQKLKVVVLSMLEQNANFSFYFNMSLCVTLD